MHDDAMPMGILTDAWDDPAERGRMSTMIGNHARALRSTARAIRSGRNEPGDQRDGFCPITDELGVMIGTISATESFAGWTSRRFETNLMPPNGTTDGLRSKLLLISIGGPFGSIADPDCLEAWARCQTAIAAAIEGDASKGIAARMAARLDMVMAAAPALAAMDGVGRLAITGPIIGSDPLILTNVLMEDASYGRIPCDACLPLHLRSEPWLPLLRIRNEDTTGMRMLVVSSLRERKEANHDPIAIMRAIARREETALEDAS
jgi:hypothetical protein